MAFCRFLFLAIVSCVLAKDPKIYFVEKFEGKLWFKILQVSQEFWIEASMLNGACFFFR